ncbi:nucleoside phosphorylase [Galactobacter valiniphilus]|uniref:nucleoside phosphorylase n=1 Tax=Galactobacter valiniphilus TaxID=2676122 RepID=UPI0037354B43
MLTRGEFPILDVDTDKNDLIGGWDREAHAPDTLPTRLVMAFLGPTVDQFAAERGWETAVELESITRDFPYYVTEHRGEKVAIVLAPLGAPAAVQNLEFGLNLGVKHVVAVGSCGALHSHEENAMLVPTRALRDEGTSYHYAPAADWIELEPSSVQAVKDALVAANREFAEVATWTTDGFYRETPAVIEARKQAGCDVVDMECSALAAACAFRGADFAQLLYTADSLADLDAHDPRGWGIASRATALDLALDAVVRLGA